jgi:uracil-DNA glycosylase
MLNVNSYKHVSWSDKFPDNNVKFDNLEINATWKNFFDTEIKTDKRYKNLDKLISKCLENGKEVFPYPDLVFSALNLTPFDKIKVVIIGQDPYFNKKLPKPEIKDSDKYPEAMGLSFSVPIGLPIPSSLKNIYNNAVKYKHCDKSPTNGNLEGWAKQGCLLLNAALTVQEGCPNSHAKYWSWITDKMIKYISDNKTGIIFVLWGAYAYNKLDLIDTNKHHVVASSHPSGLSCNNTMGQNPAFVNLDQFSTINKFLKDDGKTEIKFY